MKKNGASQVIGAQMVDASDGSAFTGSVTVYVTGDGGTQAAGSVGSGACTHEGNGFHTYAPAQAETNYDHIGFTFVGTGAVPVTVQVYPTFPQTGDAYARLGAPAGASVSADVAAVKAVLPAALVSGRIDAHMGSVADAVLTAAKFASGAFDAVWSVATRVLTAGTNIVLAKGTGVTGFNDIAAGAAMTLTSGERTAIANEVETQIIDETDSEKVLTAITDKIASVNPSLGDLSLAAIASAVWSNASRVLTAGTNIVLAKGVGVTGFNDLDAAGVRTAVGLASANLDTQLSGIAAKTTNLPADPASASGFAAAIGALQTHGDATWSTATGFLNAAGVRAAVGLASANLDAQLTAIVGDTNELQADWANGGRLDALLDSAIAKATAIQAKTDSLSFGVAGKVDANMTHINETALTGNGSSGDLFRPEA